MAYDADFEDFVDPVSPFPEITHTSLDTVRFAAVGDVHGRFAAMIDLVRSAETSLGVTFAFVLQVFEVFPPFKSGGGWREQFFSHSSEASRLSDLSIPCFSFSLSLTSLVSD